MKPPDKNLCVWVDAEGLKLQEGEVVHTAGGLVSGVTPATFNFPSRLNLGGVGRNMTMSGNLNLPVDVFLLFNMYTTALPTAKPIELSLFRGTALESLALATPGNTLKMYMGDLSYEMPFNIGTQYVLGHFIWGKHQMSMEINFKGPGWVKYKKPPVHPGGFVLGDEDSGLLFEYRVKELLVYDQVVDSFEVTDYLMEKHLKHADLFPPLIH